MSKAITLQTFHYQAPATPKSVTFETADLAEHDVTIMLEIISILLISLVITLAIKKRKTCNHYIGVDLISGAECLTLPVTSLSPCSSYW